ncbi:ParA family protein [Legionella taurinensis]|uniref:ATPase n=1 Tax=Legionella taurinensis TaxID=70611 RepID=A0AB38N0H7_9GAMM|nr:ParA family protein [Legionella taurinensis]MDX1838841.1 ParA family protein [Legionella taurinensis]PUT38574.1 ATPase [Legionella taurinensis]PUT39345.1 ATPase [Legionella taurinensis]PUT41617.1 ATPase [Legionella taurinensis]PUT44646.1 ATPase [Legionella taurinensis]
MDNKSYVIWNNKGGVGKSTITFHIASVYAQKNPEQDIVVIDMCPQANCSTMLLGGGRKGEAVLQNLISLETPKTVVGYITDEIIGEKHQKSDYFLNVSSKNDKLPANLYLLSGDGNLELISPLLSRRAEAEPISEKDNPWKKIHSIIRKLTQERLAEDRAVTYFIDTNPSFSIYTQMAVAAGSYLLVPINADDSSIFAISGLFNLIYGSGKKHPVYDKYTFARRVEANGLERPRIHLLLGNRFTQKKGTAHAFKALSNEATKKMYEEYEDNRQWFRNHEDPINSQDEFEKEFTIELRDFNSAGVVASNSGIPLSEMQEHTYKVYGESIQVAKEQREKCKEAIEALVAKL